MYVLALFLRQPTSETTSTDIFQLFESNAKPCHYMAGAKLTSPGRKPSFWRDECHPKRFWDAFRDFQGWFKNVTGREWDDRLNQSIPYDSQKFRYAVPTYGRPVGAIPVEKLPLGWFDYNDNENEDDGKNGEGKEESEEDGQLAYDTDSEPDEDEDGDTNMNGQHGIRGREFGVFGRTGVDLLSCTI